MIEKIEGLVVIITPTKMSLVGIVKGGCFSGRLESLPEMSVSYSAIPFNIMSIVYHWADATSFLMVKNADTSAFEI